MDTALAPSSFATVSYVEADDPARLPLDVPTVSRDVVKGLVAEMEKTGFATLEGYITPTVLKQMRAFVASAVEKSGGEYVGFTTRKAVAGSVFDELAGVPQFQDLIRQVYVEGTGLTPPPIDFYQVLRCLVGKTGQKHSLYFHYDSYVVTALIPVEIPTVGKTGDLVMLPNTRKIRKHYWGNVIDKLLLDNKVTQAALAFLAKHKLLRLTRIKPVPGNIYFFWGYRSVHTNEPCDPDKVRATALYHYVNPHAGQKPSLKSGKMA